MRNRLRTADGRPNRLLGEQIKNLLIFQAGGWRGLPRESRAGLIDPAWPRDGGRRAYLWRDDARYQAQLRLIRELAPSMAIATLLMPDADARAASYGVYRRGALAPWGRWRSPRAVFGAVRAAARHVGLPVAPFFSINHYGGLERRFPDRARQTLYRLEALLDWYLGEHVGEDSLRTDDGRTVVLTEGLPENTQLDTEGRLALARFMNARPDILWIDNLALCEPAQVAPHVVRSAAVFDPSGTVQEGLRDHWQERYRWHYVPRFAKSRAQLAQPHQHVGDALRRRWLNITAHDPARYPVVISQWNEYAEYLTVEPSELEGDGPYRALQAMLAEQP